MKLQELATATLFDKQMRKAAEKYQLPASRSQEASRKTTPRKEGQEKLQQVLEENRQLAHYLEQLQKVTEASGKKERSPKVYKKNRFTIEEYEGGKETPVYIGPRGGKFTYVRGKKVYMKK